MPYKRKKNFEEELQLITNDTCEWCPLESKAECENCVYKDRSMDENDNTEYENEDE